MNYNVSMDGINNAIEQMQKGRDLYAMSLDNMIWKLKLSPIELTMLNEAVDEYISQILAITSDEYKKRINIIRTYKDMKEFYFNLLPKYDINITFKEALEKYIGLSENEILQFNADIDSAIYKSEAYIANLRNNYTGSLASMLGKEQNEFDSNTIIKH